MSFNNLFGAGSSPLNADTSGNVSTNKGIQKNPNNQIAENNPLLDKLRLPDKKEASDPNGKELTQEDFFSLLSQQLSMQDPFKPVENDQMIAQMASFSTVDGISKLNEEIVSLNAVMTSSQALQASGLVGQKVLIPSSTGNLSAADQNLKAVVSAPEPMEEIIIRVEDDAGQLMTSFKVDGQSGGNIEFNWDGLNSKGNPVPEGNYNFKASGRIDGTSEALAVSTYAHVTSVSLGTAASGSVLNLRGIGGVQLADVLAVAER